MQNLFTSPSMRAPAILFIALILATAMEIFALSPSINEAPPRQEDFTTLTPRDLLSIPQGGQPHHMGLYNPASITSSAPVLTSSPEPERWLQDTRGMERHTISQQWLELSFPERKNLPSLLRASVSTAPTSSPEKTTPCKRLAPDHFSCDRPSWAAVQPREVLVNAEKTSCIWAHPLQGKITTITYPDIAPPRDANTQLMLEVAFHDHVTKDPARSIPISLTHGTQRARHVARSNKMGWQTFPVKLSEDGSPHPLVLTIQANQPGRHQLCYRFQTRPTTSSTPSPP